MIEQQIVLTDLDIAGHYILAVGNQDTRLSFVNLHHVVRISCNEVSVVEGSGCEEGAWCDALDNFDMGMRRVVSSNVVSNLHHEWNEIKQPNQIIK